MEILVRPGVELHELDEPDAEELFRLTDRNRTYLRRWLPWLDGTRCSQDTLFYIRAVRKRILLYSEMHCSIRVDGRIAGTLGTHVVDRVNQRTSLGYWLDEGCQGRGIVTDCVAAMLDHLFGELGLHRVGIQCAEGNLRSQAVPERLGFVREGVAREEEWLYDRFVDHVCYGILDREWRVRRSGEVVRGPAGS